MPYTTYTLASFTAELAAALSDPGLVFWSQDELDRATKEALLFWGALTSYWTKRGTLSASSRFSKTLRPAITASGLPTPSEMFQRFR